MHYILTLLLALLLVLAGLTHFWKPRLYLRIVPAFFPLRMLIVQLSGLVEVATGIGLLFPAYRTVSGWVVLIMMIGFLPLHIWDVFRERPAVGSKTVAIIRLPLQFVLIAWSWYVIPGAGG